MKSNNRIDQAIRYKPIIDYINRNKPKKILEIWSWSQWIWRFINISFDWLDLSKADYSTEEKNSPKNMHFIYWSALNMPIDDNVYDFVFSCDMLEHINKDNRESALNEAIRVCKKWWTVIFWFPCWFWWKLCDYSLFYLIKIRYLISKDGDVPSRLTEHIKIDYPTDREIKYLIKKVLDKHQMSIKEIQEYNSNNVFFHFISIVINISRLQYYSRIQKLNNTIIDKYLSKKSSIKSIFPYRKYIIIQKI